MEATKNCPYCGEVILTGAKKCKHCGEWLEEEIKPATSIVVTPPQVDVTPRPTEYKASQPVYVQTTVMQQSNGLGTAGFVLALIAALLSWLPGVNIITWLLGAFFSFLGLFKSPRGLAFAGLIISFIDVIIITTIFGAVAGFLKTIFA